MRGLEVVVAVVFRGARMIASSVPMGSESCAEVLS